MPPPPDVGPKNDPGPDGLTPPEGWRNGTPREIWRDVLKT